MIGQPAKLLRFYVNENDQYAGKPMYEAIVDRCHELGVPGVTVFRGLEGFGETAELHHSHFFHHDQPIVITIVESSETVQQTLSVLEGMITGGLVAVTDVEVVHIANGARTAIP